MAWWPGKALGRPKGGWIGSGLKRQGALKERAYDAGGQPPPQYNADALGAFGGAAQSGADALAGARGAQGDALGMLGAAARGEGPSVAQAQLAQQNASNVANQQAMAAQAPGGNLAAQQRQASAAGAAGAMAGQQQLAQLRAGEMAAAQNAYAGQANAMAGQGLQQQGMGLGLMGGAYGQQLGTDTQWGLGQRGMDLQQLQGNRDFAGGIAKGIFGGAAGLGSAAMMMSDERLKTSIAPAGPEAADALMALGGGATYDYVPGAGPPGRRIGTTAQDMERTPAGAAAVIETPMGKAIDRDQAIGLALAGSSEQERRLRRIEDALGVMPDRSVNTREGPGTRVVGSSFKPQTMSAALGGKVA